MMKDLFVKYNTFFFLNYFDNNVFYLHHYLQVPILSKLKGCFWNSAEFKTTVCINMCTSFLIPISHK